MNTPKTGTCEGCKHIVSLEHLQKVETNDDPLYFCPEHKKPYTRIEYGYKYSIYVRWRDSSIPSRYFIKCDWLEVDENGVLVDYVKKEKKQILAPTDVLMHDTLPEKKKRGRPLGSKNKAFKNRSEGQKRRWANKTN